MQTPEAYTSVNRRPLDIEDYLDIIRRHKAWIVGPAFAGLVIATVVACLWPNTYVSEATIRVVPQQVPESFVQSNVNSQLSQRISSMWQTISRRENLGNIIAANNLYPKDRQRKPVEDVVEQMRRDIRIGNVVPVGAGDRQVSAFKIVFEYENRLLAQKVAKELVGQFLNENQRERTRQSISTTQFLKDQLEGAKKELEAIEQKLTNFRTSANGRLPDQVQQNATQMAMLENRISNLNQGLSRVAQEKMLIEADIRSIKNQRALLTPTPETTVQRQKNDRLVSLDREIAQLEALLTNLREHYRDTYPDVRRTQVRLNAAKQMREKLAAVEEESATETATAPKRTDPAFERDAQKLDAMLERLEIQMKSKDADAKNYQDSIVAAEKQIKVLQTRIESTPVSEQQYADIVRDHQVAKLRYEDMNRKRSQSQIAEELERRQQGETLEILDDASLPQTPTDPKRPVIIGAGFGLGLVIGLMLAGAREAKDTSLKNLKDVRAYTQLTILGSVPLLEGDMVVRRRKRLALLAWATAFLVGIVIMAGATYYYLTTNV